MSTGIPEDRIRDRAYALWEADGRPADADKFYWARAERELAAEDAVDTSSEGADINLPPRVAGLLPQ